MKTRLGLLCLLIGALAAVIGLQIETTSIQSLVIGLGTNIFSIGIGIFIVNQYLESDSRKSAVRALFILSERAVADFHNSWLKLCWAKFGKEAYGRITDEYINAGGKPDALRSEDRAIIYDLYKNTPQFQQKIVALEEALLELSRMAGWNLSTELLTYCLKARVAIGHLRATQLDDSDEAKTAVTEHISDIDINTGLARSQLMELAGVDDNEE